MNLREVYARAWAKRRGLGTGWIVNLEPTFNLALGAVGIVRGGEFYPETSLELRGITDLELDPNQQRNDTPWQFQSSDQIDIQLAAEGESSDALPSPASANYKLAVSFGKNAGVSIHGTAMWWSSYADMGAVRKGIVDAARKGRLNKGESVVVTQQLTGRGIVFSAAGRNATLEAAASVDASGGTLPIIGALSGKLSLVNSSAGAQFQSFADGAVLAARVLYLGRRGWLWSRDFEASGALDTDADQIEETVMRPVEGDRDDEYFAMVR